MPIRWKSSATFLEYPVIAIAVGPDPANNEPRGHARGLIALGGLAIGGIAFGGGAIGLLAFAGLALGYFAIGGMAIGYAAVGGLAIGYYAVGGAAIGKFVIGPLHRDSQAIEFFSRLWIVFPFLPKTPPK